jgi:hypothetical protein
MLTTTDFDLRLADHLARVARVNRKAWMREASAPAGLTRTRGISTLVASIRRRAGLAVVHAGEWLQGTPAGHAVDRAAAV